MSNPYRRIAIVTGTSLGIGEAIARAFVAEGFAVVGNARTHARLTALEAELGPAFCGVPGDASDPAVVDQLFDLAKERFGQPADLVVANAGRGLGGSVKDADLTEFDTMLQLNVTGALHLMQKAARYMVEEIAPHYPRRTADIVVIGSVVGTHISPYSAVYGATKFAVHALAESLRREVGPQGIRVSRVEPGIVISGFQKTAGYGDALEQRFRDDFGPLLQGEDVARAVLTIVNQPPHVHISDLQVRPTRQGYP